MRMIKCFQASSAALIIFGMTPTFASPSFSLPMSTLAQSNRVVPAGTIIPVRDLKAKKILLAPNETSKLTLVVSADVLSPSGRVAIPAGSKVSGQLQPTEGGSQFVASEIILLSGETLRMDATSQVVTRTESVKKGMKPTTIAAGTVIGAGAATALSAIFGGGASGVKWWRSLAGAGAGAVTSGFLFRQSVELISIDPNTDLDLTLQSRLVNPYL
jgi:hypothetical protein